MTTIPSALNARALWAQNSSRHGDDPVTAVRASRDRDQATARERWARVDADVASSADRDTTKTIAAVLAGVGIAPR